MAHSTDQLMIRAKDISLMIAILTLIGLILGPIHKIYQWDDSTQKVAQLETEVNDQMKTIAVIQSEFSDISKQLDQINWQLRKIGGKL